MLLGIFEAAAPRAGWMTNSARGDDETAGQRRARIWLVHRGYVCSAVPPAGRPAGCALARLRDNARVPHQKIHGRNAHSVLSRTTKLYWFLSSACHFDLSSTLQ